MTAEKLSKLVQTAPVSDWLNAHPQVDTLVVGTPDVNGVIRGKAIPADQARKIDEGSVQMPLSLPTVDIVGEEIPDCTQVAETGDCDVFAQPVGRAPFRSLTSAATGIVLSDMVWGDGAQVETSCRHILRNIVQEYHDLGLRPVVALELEFYLYDPAHPDLRLPSHPITGRPMIGREPCLLQEYEIFAPFFADVRQACAEAGITVIGMGSENGTAMFEVNIEHTGDVLKAADDLTILRLILRDVARQHGYGATFLPKPFPDLDGAGLHIHFSLLDSDGVNVFDDGGPDGTMLLRNAVAGILRHANDMQLVMAPHYSSYRRVKPRSYAPTLIGWGYDNRFLPIRIPGGDHRARRIEHRLGGADANPYLLTALVLRAALDGIRAKSQAPASITGSPYDMDIENVVSNMRDALRAFTQSNWIKGVIPPLFHEAFVNAKTQELERIENHVSQWETDIYRDRI